jgi:hypothetical protein
MYEAVLVVDLVNGHQESIVLLEESRVYQDEHNNLCLGYKGSEDGELYAEVCWNANTWAGWMAYNSETYYRLFNE